MILCRLSILCFICFLLLNCNTTPSNFIYEPNNPAPLPQPTIVLLHGLGGATANFDAMKNQLQQEFPAEVRWLVLEEPRTAEDAINVQAESTLKQLKGENISENTPLIFVGHSQGGLKAYWISEKYGKVLNIKGIVTIETPWESTPLLGDPQQKFLIGLQQAYQQESIAKQIAFWTKAGQAGVEDMKPSSDFLKKVQISLKNNQTPVFAIASKTTIPPAFTLLGQFLFGTADHDLLVPVDSQLAKNIPVNTKTFQRNAPVVGAAHFPIGSAEFALDHLQVIQLVKTFIASKINAT